MRVLKLIAVGVRRPSMRSTTWTRLGIAAFVGAAAAILTLLFGLPGRGEWIAVCWLAGLAVGLRLPGAHAWLAGLGGIALGLAVGLAVGGGSWTLVGFALLALGGVYSHGWSTAWVVRRLRKLGSAAARDVPTLLASAALLSLVGFAVWLAMEFARNPL
jgi:hypothetical protein